jgi:hypothetical protein
VSASSTHSFSNGLCRRSFHISLTRFEVRHRNWRPNRDPDILIIKPRLGA